MVIHHLKQIGKVKKLDQWESHELTSNQNDHYFLLFYETINQPFLDGIVTCDESGFYMTPSNSQFSDWTEKKLQVHFSCSVVSDSLRPHGLYVSHQTHMSMEFSRQEYWSGLPFPFLGDLPDPGIEPGSPAFQPNALTSEPMLLQ